MDAELKELESLFQQAQQSKPTSRLSERSVVELVLKLQQIGLLDADLLHTVSGKEYLTQERLQKEMEVEINRFGRVSVIEMASSIGVDLYHCEKQAQQIVQSNSGLSLVQGEVISTGYWDDVAEEINETLKEASHVSVSELARKYSVGAELLTGILSSRIGTLLHAKLEAGQLYTPAYVSRVKATVRGAVRALLVPTSLQSVWISVQNLLREKEDSGVSSEGGLFHMVLNELLAEKSINGSFRSGGSLWTPAVFVQSQRQSVEAFYSQNGYISYDALRKLSVPQPKQYLQTKYPEGVALDTIFAHCSFTAVLDSAVEEAIAGGHWCNSMEVLPEDFTSSDSGQLLALCPSVEKALKESSATIIAETCIVSINFMKELSERFQSEIRDSLKKVKIPVKKIQEAVEQNGDTISEKESLTKQIIKKTEKKQQQQQKRGNAAAKLGSSTVDSEEEDNGKSGRGRKKSGKTRNSNKEEMKSSNKKSKSDIKVTCEDTDVPPVSELARRIIDWFPEIEGAGSGDGTLAQAMADELRPALLSFAISLKRATVGTKSEEKRLRIDSLKHKLSEEYANFQLFVKALDLFDDDKMQVILQRHLLRTAAADVTDLFLESQNLQQKVENAEIDDENILVTPFTNTLRLNMAKNLPGSLSVSAIEMVESLDGKSIMAFESALATALEESGIRYKIIDKKSERTLLHTYRKSLAEEIENENDPIALLPKVVALLYAQAYGRALQAPGRAMAAAVAHLKGKISEEAYQVIECYHTSTVSVLSLISTNDELDEEASKRELLQQQMSLLKSIIHIIK